MNIPKKTITSILNDPDCRKKFFKKCQSALSADTYRITTVLRYWDGFVRELDFSATMNSADRNKIRYTPDEVTKAIKHLEILNTTGFEIYLTPFSKEYQYVVVEHLSDEKFDEFCEHYSPCLVIGKPMGNCQAVLKLRKDKIGDAYIAEDIVEFDRFAIYINKRYGEYEAIANACVDDNIFLSGKCAPTYAITGRFSMPGYASREREECEYPFPHIVKAQNCVSERAEMQIAGEVKRRFQQE